MLQETFRWNGITNKKKGQKWGIEKSTFVKGDDNKWSYQECSGSQNAEEKQELLPVDFDKLISYTSLPKVWVFQLCSALEVIYHAFKH